MELLDRHFETAFDAPGGIKRLRELILSLAIQGKLVQQDPNDPPAHQLLKGIGAERQRPFKERKIKELSPSPSMTPDEVPFDIPNGWEWIRLGEIGIWKSGSTPSRTNKDYYGGSVPWVKSGEVKRGRIWTTEETITEAALERCSLHLNPIGSVLLAMYGANIGEVGMLEIEAATNQAVCACQPSSVIDKHYLLAMLVSMKRNFISQGAGAAQPNISREKIVGTIAPLPPLPEQVRIVARINELMARCDQLEKLRADRDALQLAVHTSVIRRLLNVTDATEQIQAREFLSKHFLELYTVKKNVSDLRKAILQLAAMGKLVPQNHDEPPASDLLREIEIEKARLVKAGELREPTPLPQLKAKDIPYAVPQSWQWVRMGDLCNRITSGSTPSKEYFSEEDGIPFLKVYNIRNQVIDFSYKRQFVNINYHQQKMGRSRLVPGDVVMNIVGPPLGKTAIIPNDYPEYNCNQAIAVFRPFVKTMNSYLYTYLLAGTFLDKIELVGTAGQDNISVTKSQMMPIPLPPLSEQERIVKRVNLLMTQCDNLEQYIDAASKKQASLLDFLMAQFEGQRCA